MKVFIDADGCPVVNIAAELAAKYNAECFIICDDAHVFNIPHTETITVSKGADSVDFKLVNLIGQGDVAVTQDYGLAAMCLAKRAVPVNQNGLVFSDENIEKLLYTRFVSKKIRMAGGRTKGPSKRTREQDEDFRRCLEAILAGDFQKGKDL